VATAAQNFAAGVKASIGNQAWPPPQMVSGGHSFMPYQANVVWQDTTSNATYCSVSSALGG
jgi:hypothetical protein